MTNLEFIKTLTPRELVSQKQKNDRAIEYSRGFNTGYNKAINDYVTSVKDTLITDYSVFNTDDIRMFIDIIEELAEQLKAGGKQWTSINYYTF